MDSLIFFVFESLPSEQRPTSIAQFFNTTVSDPSALKFLYNHLGPVTLYNVAVIAYHLGFIHPAAEIAQLLYANVEAMEEWLALKTCFLSIDVHLRLADVSSATTVATYAEKLIPSFAKPSAIPDASPSPPSCEMKTVVPDWPGRTKGILDSPISYEDIKFCMHIYNARLSATTDSVSDAMRSNRKEAKSAVLAAGDAETRPTAAALLVKARVEQSYSKGLRILASIVNQSPPHVVSKFRPLALNSLGVLHHRLGRHALAACYFEHSRQAFDHLFREASVEVSPVPINFTILRSAKDSHVSFNLALQYMKLSDYARALDLFTICARNDPTYANDSALLWIRMAECCVGIESSSNVKQSLVVEGQGRGRRMIMRSDGRDEGLTMEYAATCARSAIVILDRQKGIHNGYQPSNPVKAKRYSILSDSTSRQGHGKAGQSDTSSPPSPDGDRRIREAALLLLAYASLSFDPNAVIHACDELHKLYPNGSNDRCMLRRLYAAEAYCVLGRPEEAANRLTPLLGMNTSTDSPIKESAYINMALAHASSGDIATASQAAKVTLKAFASSQKPNKVLRKEAIFAASYIFLRSGETDTARRCLRSLMSLSD